MLRRVALLRTKVSEELSASVIRVTRIGELGTTLAVTNKLVTASFVHSSSILVTLMNVALSPSETSVLTRVIRHNILEDDIHDKGMSRIPHFLHNQFIYGGLADSHKRWPRLCNWKDKVNFKKMQLPH
jgi:hypothetical protein